MIASALADIRLAVTAARALIDTDQLDPATLLRLLAVIDDNAAVIVDLVVADPPLPGLTAFTVLSHAETIAAQARRLDLTVVHGGRP